MSKLSDLILSCWANDSVANGQEHQVFYYEVSDTWFFVNTETGYVLRYFTLKDLKSYLETDIFGDAWEKY